MSRRLGVVTLRRSPQGVEGLCHLPPAGPSVYRWYAVACLQCEFRTEFALDCLFKFLSITFTTRIKLHRGHAIDVCLDR